jgi:hypothetical protein
MTRRFLAALCVLQMALLLPTVAFAQATGQINGIVTDGSGAVLPGVTVEATNSATGIVRTAVTGADGLYTIPLLQPGDYDVKASLQGFRTALQEKVRVTVSETARVALTLEVGSISETVSVVATATLVETSNATHGIVIDNQKVVDLPLNGRNFTQLGTLIPGVVAPPAALGGQSGDATPGGFGNATGGFNVNGMRNQSNNFLMDGAANNDTFNTGFVLRPPPDAIEEFKILTNAFGAEYGRNAGSVVNLVTKAGSNRLSGSAWEFNRDDALQARNFFAQPDAEKPKLKQNQFGVAAGFPIVKNKLFGFGYYDGFRNETGTVQNLAVLSEAQRRGDFSALATPIRDPLTGQPFPGNVIPAGRLDPVSQRLLNEFVPLPNSPNNRYIVSPTLQDDRDQFGLRMDYQLSEKQSILGRYTRAATERITPRTVQPADQRATATLQDFMGSHTYLFSATAINTARFSINRIYANPQVTSGFQTSQYGINLPSTNPLAVGLPSISVAGFFGGTAPFLSGLGDPQQPFVERINHVWQITDDFTWVTGRHQLKFGFDIRREAMNIAFINRPNGDMVFDGSITGNAAADFLIGRAAQARATTQQAIQDGYGYLYAGYLQDEFRISSNVTLNLGMRYELPMPFVEREDRIGGFVTGRQSTVYPNAPAGLVYPGDDGIGRGIVPTDKNNFAPRLAATWDPFGDGRTSIRGAFGVFYDALAGQGDFFQSGVLTPPFTPLVELNAPAVIPISDPLRSVAGPPNPFPPALTVIGWGDQFTSPYAYHFNGGVQRQLTDRLGAEVAYVGSRGFNLPMFFEVNPGVYTPGQTARSPLRVMPAFALVRPTFSAAQSWYDSFQASLRLLPTRGLNFLAAYTLGHAQDHVSGLNIGGESRPVLPVVQGDEASLEAALAQEKGDALFDVRHRFVLSFGYELPRLEDKSAVVRHLAGGWQVNGIYQVQTGFPLTVIDPTLDIRYLTNRPNVTCDPNGGPETTDQYFDTSCFARRSIADTGVAPSNQARNTVRGPGLSRTDLSFFKNIPIASTQRVQLRVEIFNIWNEERFGQPGNQIGTPNFGRITAAEDGRIVQLGIRYTF